MGTKRAIGARTIATLGVAVCAFVTAIGTAAVRGHAVSATIPPTVLTQLTAHQISVTQIDSPPAGILSAAQIEAKFQPASITGAYLVSMTDTSGTGWTCPTCWLIVYTPVTPDISQGGLKANFYADFFRATTGNLVTGIHGLF